MAPRKPTKSRVGGNDDQPVQSSEEVTPPPPSRSPSPPASESDSLGDEADIETLHRAYRRLKRRHQRRRSRSRSPKLKVSKPPEFTGKTSEFKSFMSLCSLTFTMQPRTYRSDEKKVLFMIAQFRGDALFWARQIVDNPNHPLRRDYDAFIEALNNLYLDRNARTVASQKLLRLRQTGSVSSYATKFQSLAAIVEFGDNSLRDMFYDKLDSDIKDRLVMMEMAPTLKGLINQAITLDQRSYQRRLEDKNSASSGTRRKTDAKPKADSTNSKPQASRNDSRTTSKPQSSSASSSKSGPSKSSVPSSSHSHSKPRGPLSDAEKRRRKAEGLCNYCGDLGHFADTCPHTPQNRKAQTSAVALDSLDPAPVLYPENFQSQDPPRQGN